MSAPRRRTTIALAVITLAGSVGISQAGASSASGPAAPATVGATSSPAASVPDGVKADLAFNRDEERMARDLYQLLATQHTSATVFANIAKSEQRHYDAIGTLLTRYGLPDPAAGKSAGQYANADLQKLYDGWKERGLQSQASAYQVGIELEKRDIADLERMMTQTTKADITRVYSRLLAASRQHLSAFTAASQGKTVCPSGTPSGTRQGGRGSGPGAGPGLGRGAQQGQGPGQGAGMGRGSGMGLGRNAGPEAGGVASTQRSGAGPAGWSMTA